VLLKIDSAHWSLQIPLFKSGIKLFQKGLLRINNKPITFFRSHFTVMPHLIHQQQTFSKAHAIT